MIIRFDGEHDFLSNFEPVRVQFDGINYRSVEHAYQAAKSLDAEWRKFCKQEKSPGKVKKESRKIMVRADWDEVKIPVMRELLWQKFSQEPFRSLLLETGGLHIMECNTWGDTFWGVDLRSGEGRNFLGQILMEIRAGLRGGE